MRSTLKMLRPRSRQIGALCSFDLDLIGITIVRFKNNAPLIADPN